MVVKKRKPKPEQQLQQQQPQRKRRAVSVLYGDLLAAIFITVILDAIVYFAPKLGSLRIALGACVILLIPGYVIVSALFPEKKDLSIFERLALSLGLSIAVIPLIGLALNYTPWGIRLLPILISTSIFIIVVAIIASYRRYVTPEEDRFYFTLVIPSINFSKYTLTDKILVIVIFVLIITAGSIIYYAIITPKRGEKFTEFYILSAGGSAVPQEYPRNLTVDTNATVIVGIVCREYETTTYTLKIRVTPIEGFGTEYNYRKVENWSASIVLASGDAIYRNLTLTHNERWEQKFTFSISMPGKYNLEFLLYKTDNIDAPYRTLRLSPLTVQNTSSPTSI